MRIHILCCAVFTIATCLGQTPSGETPRGEPVASVGGQPILDDELAPLVEGQLRQLQYQAYLARRKALDDLINQRLVASKAKEKGLTAEEFLRQNIDNKLPEPTETEIQAFYFHQRNLSNIPFQQVKGKILVALKQQNVERARQDYFEHLRQSSDVVVMLRPPKVEVPGDSSRSLGNPDAPVNIVEFSDFECPFCQKATPTLRELLSKYNGQVRLTFRDFPLEEIHPESRRAAEAARCATEQGKFWAYHDLLFASPVKLAEEDLRQHARGLGLNMSQFDSCLRDRKFTAQIDEDLKAGNQAGVSGTPAFFINGVFFNGLQPLSALESTIDDELASLKSKTNKPEARAN